MAIVLLCGALLFLPYTSTLAPALRIQVVDGSGVPIPGLTVRGYWKYFGKNDIISAYEIGKTDGEGRYAVHRRTFRASLVARFSSRDAPERLRAGPSLWILACDNSHLHEARLFWQGNYFWNSPADEGESRLVAKPVKSCLIPID